MEDTNEHIILLFYYIWFVDGVKGALVVANQKPAISEDRPIIGIVFI
jgi:hypothetical protein